MYVELCKNHAFTPRELCIPVNISWNSKQPDRVNFFMREVTTNAVQTHGRLGKNIPDRLDIYPFSKANSEILDDLLINCSFTKLI